MRSTTATVGILSSSSRVRDVVGPIPSARYVTSPSTSFAPSLIVALIADLFEGERRQALHQVVSKYRGELPVVLFQPEGAPVVGQRLQALVSWSRELQEEPYVTSNAAVIRRIVLAWRSKAEQRLIASASIENGNLVMWSCEPKKYVVPVAQLPALAAMKPASLSKLEVSASGSRIHWADGDVDLDAESVRAMADPPFRQQQEALRRREAARYASAIRSLRMERGLRQADIEGLTGRQVRRLEEGDTIPHSSTLQKLATAHRMTVDMYLKELARRSSRTGAEKGNAAIARRGVTRGRRPTKKSS